MTEWQNLTVEQLRKVLSIKEQIDRLQAQIEATVRDGGATISKKRRVRRLRSDASAFALVSNLCGSLTGPSDLATNPKHLEGFGA